MAAWIGTSGGSYDHWHPELYPPGLPGQDVFVYFNNDGEANAVRNARTLRTLLSE